MHDRWVATDTLNTARLGQRKQRFKALQRPVKRTRQTIQIVWCEFCQEMIVNKIRPAVEKDPQKELLRFYVFAVV